MILSPIVRRAAFIVVLVFIALQVVSLFRRRADDRQNPRLANLIFVGGVPRSGTTLMRSLLDVLPNVRCGEETRVVPNILTIAKNWEAGAYHRNLLEKAGVTHKVLRDAVGAFIFEVIANHGARAPRLCNKDPLTFEHLPYLREMFPNARYVLMVRDGRAIVHSIISRKVPVVGFNWENHKECLRAWNKMITKMYGDCKKLGPSLCLPVRYESLILRPREELPRITTYLGEPWTDDLLHHEKFVGTEIRLNPMEFSTSQVKRALNNDALNTWRDFYSPEVLSKIDELAPMLRTLGYNTTTNDPSYDGLGAL